MYNYQIETKNENLSSQFVFGKMVKIIPNGKKLYRLEKIILDLTRNYNNVFTIKINIKLIQFNKMQIFFYLYKSNLSFYINFNQFRNLY